MENLFIELPIPHRNYRIQFDYLKEALSVSKQITVALLSAYAGFIISYYLLVQAGNRSMVANPSEVLILSLFSGFQIIIVSIYFIIGPLLIPFKITLGLLSQLKLIAQQNMPLRRRKHSDTNSSDN